MNHKDVVCGATAPAFERAGLPTDLDARMGRVRIAVWRVVPARGGAGRHGRKST
jgi:hypothetical protein